MLRNLGFIPGVLWGVMEKRGLSRTRRYAMWKVHQRPQARADDKPGLQSRGPTGDVGRKILTGVGGGNKGSLVKRKMAGLEVIRVVGHWNTEWRLARGRASNSREKS